MNKLVILTGPPGPGKLEYAYSLSNAEVYARELGNHAEWRFHRGATTPVLITSAPGRNAKEYWAKQAAQFGFDPDVLTYNPGRETATNDYIAAADCPTEPQRRRLAKAVQRWYAQYGRWHGEVVLRASSQ